MMFIASTRLSANPIDSMLPKAETSDISVPIFDDGPVGEMINAFMSVFLFLIAITIKGWDSLFLKYLNT
ncbi:MAG TPA: hypothetical protein DCP92_14850 [Nitrospiraceae bacterium]|nr:hypothetical protein [Nitrospiraceae bacterium]